MGSGKLTAADLKTVVQDLGGLLTVADSSRAVTETVDEVLVGAQAANIAGVTSKLLGLLGTDHVAGASTLLMVRDTLAVHCLDLDLHHTGGDHQSSGQRRQQPGRRW